METVVAIEQSVDIRGTPSFSPCHFPKVKPDNRNPGKQVSRYSRKAQRCCTIPGPRIVMKVEKNLHKRKLQSRSALLLSIKSCTKQRNLREGSRLHARIIEWGLPPIDLGMYSSLISMYAKCGALAEALDVFNELPAADVVCWTVLIAGYAQHGYGNEALECFEKMRSSGLTPDAVTFVCILKACACIGAVHRGEDIHDDIRSRRLLENNVFLGTALVDMYAKCGALSKAQEVFDELLERNIVSWTSLISGYVQHGYGDEALACFSKMQDHGLSPNTITFSCILKACGITGSLQKGEEIHANIESLGLVGKDIVLGTALVDMYAKCGALTKAKEVFDGLWFHDLVSWNALIAAYAEHGLGDEALNFFEEMRSEGHSPNVISFASALKACGAIGSIDRGEAIHAELKKQRLLEESILLQNALVDMYVKCGVPAEAQFVFDAITVQDVVSWTALIGGYAQLGQIKMVFTQFSRMIAEDVVPNAITFVTLLTVCSHAGLVDEGKVFFDTMRTVYCLTPTLQHHTCMVDLFSRAGQFEESLNLIENVSPSVCLPLWSSFLGGCREQVNMELGIQAFEHLMELDQNNVLAYVCLSNIYVVAGVQEEADCESI